jgi:hypothetical protein
MLLFLHQSEYLYMSVVEQPVLFQQLMVHHLRPGMKPEPGL